MTDPNIPCPVCNTAIPVNTKQLIEGVQFSCPNCTASIGLTSESKSIVEETMSKMESLKKKPVSS